MPPATLKMTHYYTELYLDAQVNLPCKACFSYLRGMISKRYFPGSSEFGGSSLTLLKRSWMTPCRPTFKGNTQTQMKCKVQTRRLSSQVPNQSYWHSQKNIESQYSKGIKCQYVETSFWCRYTTWCETLTHSLFYFYLDGAHFYCSCQSIYIKVGFHFPYYSHFISTHSPTSLILNCGQKLK